MAKKKGAKRQQHKVQRIVMQLHGDDLHLYKQWPGGKLSDTFLITEDCDEAIAAFKEACTKHGLTLKKWELQEVQKLIDLKTQTPEVQNGKTNLLAGFY